MSKMYKIPPANVAAMKTIVGKFGTRLWPIEDKMGNWLISPEELNAPEFSELLTVYKKISDKFLLIDYIPKDVTSVIAIPIK